MVISRDHFISIKDGKFDTTTSSDLDHLFRTLAADPNRDRIVIHFHGGLVTQKSATATAEQRLLDHYRAVDAYPIFFFWQTGFWDLVTGNLGEIIQEKIFGRLLMRVAQFVLAKLGQTSGTRGARLELPSEFEIQDELARTADGLEPFQHVRQNHLHIHARLSTAEATQFREVLETDMMLQAQAMAIADSTRSSAGYTAEIAAQSPSARASTHTLMSLNALAELHTSQPQAGERGLITTGRITQGAIAVLARTIERLANQRDHGVYPTIVEEILHEFYLGNVGQLGWALMKKDAADAFKPDTGQYSGTAFLEHLRAYWAAGNRPRIILVGHSAGCVFICNLLQHAAAVLPPEVKFDLVFLAPACTFDLFAETYDLVWPRIGGLRLFTMRDELEIQDHLGPGYPRSILYFVSGVLENERDKPIMGMQRYYYPEHPFDPGACPTVERVRKILRRPGRTVWSIEDSGAGRASYATTHKAFDDKDPATLQSIAHIISQGF